MDDEPNARTVNAIDVYGLLDIVNKDSSAVVTIWTYDCVENVPSSDCSEIEFVL